MPDKIPLVLDLTTGGPQQLQRTDELDINLNSRVAALERQLYELCAVLIAQGIEVPGTILKGN